MNPREHEAPGEMFNINPLQWQQAIGMAEEFCMAIAAKGGSPIDATGAYGLTDCRLSADDWARAAQLIALTMCAPADPRPC